MALFDPTTGEYNDAAFALDTHEAIAGNKSIFESAGDVITKGIPLTGLAVINSFANTAIDVGNFLGADMGERVKMEDEIGDGTMLDYYKQHTQGIEAAGLLAGSFIPGTIAIKALKLAQAGKLSVAMQRATGIFSGPKEKILEGARAEIYAEDPTSTLFGNVNADKFKAIALGFGDQALQGLVYEAATLATMKASPLLDKDGIREVTENMFYGALLGGGIGGVIEGIGTRAIFNKALIKADTSTKAQELATYLGRGGYFAGDRVATLLTSLDEMPAATNRLGKKKMSATQDAALLNSRKILGSLVQPGDEELTNGFMDILLKMKDGGMDKEEMYGYLARLAKVSRVDAPATVPTGDYLYINRFAKNATADTWEQLATGKAEEAADVSLRYRMRPFSTEVHIARFNDTIEWEGMTSSKFSDASDAYSQGYDIFIDKNLKVMVNEQAPNLERVARPGESRALSMEEERAYRNSGKLPEGSKPLYGAPVVLNIKTGSISESALPVVGDFGKVQLFDKGLQFGERSSIQLLDTPITAETSTLDANARYVWWEKRGVQRGDVILKEDVAGLEQLYREAMKLPEDKLGRGFVDSLLDEKRVSIAGIEGNVGTQDLLNLIRQGKDDLIHDLLSGTPESLGQFATRTGDEIGGVSHLRGIVADLAQTYVKEGADAGLARLEDLAAHAPESSGFSKEVATKGFISSLDKELTQRAAAFNNKTSGPSKLSSAEVAQRANVPESYLSNALKAEKPADYLVPPESSSTLQHVKLEYDVGALHQQDGQILRGFLDFQYRKDLITNSLDTAGAKFFGGLWKEFKSEASSSEADIVGAGAKGFSSANAAYGSLGQKMERIGRRMTTWATERMADISGKLSPAVNAIRGDEVAAAELGMFRAVRQRTSERYSFLPPELAVEMKVSPDTAVLTRALRKDRSGNIVSYDRNYKPEGFQHASEKLGTPQKQGLLTSYQLSPKVAAFERANQEINDARLAARNNWYAAQGLTRSFEPGSLYTPAIDTTKYPHFALVKARPGTGMAADEVSIIVGETAADLEQKIASLKDEYSIYTKDLLKTHHEVLGDYEYGQNFAQSSVDSTLARRGILNNVYPDTRAETIVKDYIDWHTKQELRLARDHVEILNGQLFSELREMGNRFTSAETSKTGFVAAMLGRTAPNPYNSYIKTALAISDKEEYRLWHDSNEKLEAFFSTAFRAAKSSFIAANKGLLSYEEASKLSQKFGLGNPYESATSAIKAYYEVANKLPPERYLSKFVATANSVLAATAIRLDFFQSVINAVSTPVLLLSEANSARSAEVAKLLTTELPDGSGRMIPATSKLFYNAVSNWFSKDIRDQWSPLYKQLGAVRDRSSDYFQMIDHLTLPYGKFSESEMVAKLKSATDLGAKLTGSELSEEFGRFIAADTARQLFEAAGYTGKDLTDNISTFVNRVHGNYIASQRPVAFQGPIGQAIGLFQTYQFNLLQQLFRYVENGEAKTLGILAGVQGTLFGMQGLPGFQAINNHIIGNAAGNPSHKDLYSTIPSLVDKKLGDYLLYGTLSNWMSTGLYSRGDINPRQITILPTNPLDYPAISGGIKFIGSMLDTAQKVAQGGGITSSVLLGLEHNGLSRPLTGLAQMVQGFSSTAKGSLVAVTRPDNTIGLSELVSAASFGRLLGARPLDEAVTMDAMYRKTLYQAKDSARVADLGQAVKTSLYGNHQLSPGQLESFATSYAASGGNIRMFGRELLQWSQDANSSVANHIYRTLRSPLSQQMMLAMGGQRLPDYSTPPPVAPTSPQEAE